MNWDKLKVFHSAAEAGSFTHAGEQLGLSQSAVSRQVSALEQELAVALFHRHARGLILTEQGELLYRTAHEVKLWPLRITEAKYYTRELASLGLPGGAPAAKAALRIRLETTAGIIPRLAIDSPAMRQT